MAIYIEKKKKKKSSTNPLLQMAKFNKKTNKKGARGWFVNPNAGDVEYNVSFFNNVMTPNTSVGSADGNATASGPTSGESAAGMGEKLINKSCKDNEYFLEAKEDIEKFKTWLNDDDVFELFNKLKPRLKSPYNDIYYIMKNYSQDDFVDYLNDLSKVKTKKEKDIDAKQGATLVAENEYYKVYHITSFAASQKYGKGTKWCITGNNGEGQQYWDDYTDKGIQFYFYIPKDSKHDKYALALNPDKSRYEIYDSSDTSVSFIPNAPKTSFYEAPKTIKDFILSKDGKTLISYVGTKSELTPDDFPKNITIIGQECFRGNESLTSVVLPSTIVEIDDAAFFECSSLTSINISNSVTSIGQGAFIGCSSLTSINISNSVTYIGDSAFMGCSSLTSITIPNSVTSIGDSAFEGCSSLTSITIPNGVTNIDSYVFSGCSSLTSITIPDSVTSIGRWTFSGCSSLTSIVIPDSVTSIGVRAFYKCSSLTSIIIPSSVKYISDSAFRNCSNLTIYCEASQKPSNWENNWDSGVKEVVWDYKDSLQEQDDSSDDIESDVIKFGDVPIYEIGDILEEQSIKEGLQVSSFYSSSHAYVLFPDGKLFDVSEYNIHANWVTDMLDNYASSSVDNEETFHMFDEDDAFYILDELEFIGGLVTLNTGKSVYENRSKIVVGSKITQAQYSIIEDFLYFIYENSSDVRVFKAVSSSNIDSKLFMFDEYTPEDIIDSIKNSFRSGGVLEDKENSISDKDILNDLDEAFGQSQVYMWSTYILPNGHFLNPENFNDDEFIPGYEHYDFDDYVYSKYGNKGLDVLETYCMKMNVTWPYITLPLERWTNEQQQSFIEIINHKNNFESEIRNEYYSLGFKNAYDVEEPLIIYAGNSKQILLDLSIESTNDIIKKINNFYSRGILEDKHQTLNRKIWNDDMTLKEDVKEKIIQIIYKFMETLQDDDIQIKIIDAVLVGSNASYNYTDESDLDLHIIAEIPEDEINLLLPLYNAYKTIFNSKYDIDFFGVNVELYVEPNETAVTSNGIYSVFYDKWISVPDRDLVKDVKVDASEWINKVENALNNSSISLKEVDELLVDIYKLRKDSIKNYGEYGEGNLIFKELRNNELISNLKDKKIELESNSLSLENKKFIDENDAKNHQLRFDERVENFLFGNDETTEISLTNITAWKDSESKENNINAMKDLENDIKQTTTDYAIVDGNYGGNLEKSFIVFNLPLKKSKELAKKYNQESIFWGTPSHEDGKLLK